MDDKKQHVRMVALQMIEANGLINLSRVSLCEAAGIPDGSFMYVMGCTFSDLVEGLKKEMHDIILDNIKGNGVQPAITKHRANPELRRDQILKTAVTIAGSVGYNKITRELIANHLDISVGLINRYFGTMPNLKRDIMRSAIKNEILPVIAQGLANGDKHAKKAPHELKIRAAATITGP